MKRAEKQIITLEKPEYFDIVLEILSGNDYASGIARELHKKQPTVTAQLNTLESLGIIQLSERRKAKRYELVAEPVCNYFYDMIEEFTNFRAENDDLHLFQRKQLKKIDRSAIERAIPCDFLIPLLGYYAIGQLDVVGGKAKALDEIVIEVFGALETLTKKYKNILLKDYQIDEKTFDSIVDVMAFESIEKARIALITMLDDKKENRPPLHD